MMLRRVFVLLALAVLSLTTNRLAAQCDLAITNAGPCDYWGSFTNQPQVGPQYRLKVIVKVTGTPAKPFRIKWTIANQTQYTDNVAVGAGSDYTWTVMFPLALDCTMPWSVTLDPGKVSGDTNWANNTASGTFTPWPPLSPVNYGTPTLVRGHIDSTLRFVDGSGTIGDLWVLFGAPSIHAAQWVLAAPGPGDSTRIASQPYASPVFEVHRSNVAAGTFVDTQPFTAGLMMGIVNPTRLRDVTWFDLEELDPKWRAWLAPDPTCESADPAISSFVALSLPSNYRTNTTPYDAARLLHLAVVKALAYTPNPAHGDAIGVLRDGRADSAGYAALLVACLRCAGIPARRLPGIWVGESGWHCRVEWCLTGTDWLIADPAEAQAADPTGTYPYYFGFVPDSHQFLALDVGDLHQMPYADFPGIQQAAWWCTGGATFDSATCTAHLEEATTNSAPTIAASVTPTAGAPDSSYVISAVYRDADGDPPSYIRASILDQYSYFYGYYDLAPDQPGPRDYRAGVHYTYTFKPGQFIPTGQYSVQLDVYDGIADPFRVTTDPVGNPLRFTVGAAANGLHCYDATVYVGQFVDLYASLTRPGTSTPLVGKMMTLRLDGASVGQGATNAAGLAQWRYTAPIDWPGGEREIRADFAGDADCPAATATSTLKVLVNTCAAMADMTGALGQTITLRATLRRDNHKAVAGETVQFLVADHVVGTAVTAADGVAALDYTIPTAVTANTESLLAEIVPADHYVGGGNTATLTILKPTTAVTVDSAACHPDDNVTLAAALTSGQTALVGRHLTFNVNGNPLGMATTDQTGRATYVYKAVGGRMPGAWPIVVEFTGDSRHAGCSGTNSLTVTTRATNLSVPDQSGYAGQSLKLAATLTNSDTGAGLVSESLSFKVDGAEVGTGYTLTSGAATFDYTIPASMPAGAHTLSVDYAGDTFYYSGTSASATLTVTRTVAPTVSAITPNTGLSIGPVAITNLAGANFRSGATVKLTLSGTPDIIGSNVVVVSPTKITCTLDLLGKAPGAYAVTVTHPDGQSGTKAAAFTVVKAPPPSVSSITPNAGLNSGSVSITNLAGANFVSGAAVKLTLAGKPDLVATNVTVVSATKITCTLPLSGAAAGGYAVAVTNPDAQSGTKAAAFTVTRPPAPTVSSTTPPTGLNNGPVSISNLAGANFVAGATVKLTLSGKPDIVATNVTVVSATKITCTLPLSGAAAGAYAVVVTNPDGQSGTKAAAFTVTKPPAPTVSAITPSTGLSNGSVSVTNLAGANLVSGATVKLTLSGKPDLAATNVAVVSATKITCTLNLAGAAAGSYAVVVTNPDGQSGTKAAAFTVTKPPAPTVSAITPSTGLNNGSVSVTNLAGANLVSGATVKLTLSGKPDIAATNVTVVSATKITCTLPLSGAAAGAYAVVVTNPDGQSGTKAAAFTVTKPPAPTVSAITPSTGLNNGSVSVTNLAGANLVSGATVKLTLTGKPDLAATNVAVVSSTKITCTLNLAGAAAGSYAVVVTNPDGQSGTKAAAFTVTKPPAPTVSAITPNTGLNNGSVSVTNLAGANFVSGATVKLTLTGKPDLAATNVAVVSATKITFTVNLANAATGSYSVVVTNPDGQSGTKAGAFTVKKP